MNTIIIGKDSIGSDHLINLNSIPLLMISYCEESQLDKIYGQFSAFDDNNFMITNTRHFDNWSLDKSKYKVYFKDEPENGTVISRFDLLQIVLDEIVIRQKILKAKRTISFSRYESLNTWNEVKLEYCFLVIDDIWDIITAKPKKLGLNLIMAMLYGPAVGIHTIFASAISYRNLLQQLVSIHPILTIELKKKYGVPEPKQLSTLGHELIFTPEDFVYYKKGSIGDMEKFYKS